MELLSVDLQEGYSEDTIVLTTDGVEIARRENVTTRLLLGYADHFELELPDDAMELTVSIPTRRLSVSIPLTFPGACTLGLSIRSGQIEYILSDEPYGYL